MADPLDGINCIRAPVCASTGLSRKQLSIQSHLISTARTVTDQGKAGNSATRWPRFHQHLLQHPLIAAALTNAICQNAGRTVFGYS